MRKSNRGIIIVFCIILLGPAFLYFIGNFPFSDSQRYEKNWHIVLPDHIKSQYDLSDFGGNGDGSSYAIYDLDEEGSATLGSLYSNKNTEMQNQIIKILKRLKVDSKKYPDFSHNYQWKILSMKSDNRNKLYILYDTVSSLAYFIQDFY